MIGRPDYSPHAAFAAPARPSAQAWRLVVGIALSIAGFLSLNALYGQLIFALESGPVPDIFIQIAGEDTPLAMYLLLGSFALMLLSTFATVALVHRRGPGSLFGPAQRFVPDFVVVVVAVSLLGIVVTLLPPWGALGEMQANIPLGRWLLLLPLSLVAVLIQVSAEEVFFRGYIQQQLAARFASPLVWMILPASVFGALHYDPSAGTNTYLIIAWATVFGVLMADLTARSGSLGPAIAVHFCNNVSAIVFVSLPDTLSGLALYLTPFGVEDADALRAGLPVDFALMIVIWLTARIALRR